MQTMQGKFNQMKFARKHHKMYKNVWFPIRFVDVIHTDILPLTRGGLGMPNAIGHVDFYPVNTNQII